MKIKKEHYEFMEKQIDKLFKGHSHEITEHIKSLRKNPDVKDINKRIRWDIFYATKSLQKFTCDVLYDYLHDEHINTALKKIVKKYGF